MNAPKEKKNSYGEKQIKVTTMEPLGDKVIHIHICIPDIFDERQIHY